MVGGDLGSSCLSVGNYSFSRWQVFRYQRRCIKFVEEGVLEEEFQWFIYIVSYIQFVSGETVSTAESHNDEVHAKNVCTTKEQSIVISAFNTDAPLILGGLVEVKESYNLITETCMPTIWSDHDGVRGVLPRLSKSLQYQIIKLQAGFNIVVDVHMEVRLIASELLGNCGIFCLQPAVEIEDLHIHLVTKLSRDISTVSWRSQCCTVVLTTVIEIFWELSKFRVESDTNYWYEYPLIMAVQYLGVTLQDHCVMDELLSS